MISDHLAPLQVVLPLICAPLIVVVRRLGFAWALASRLLRLLIHATPLQLVDRALGGGFVLLRGAVLLLAVASVVSLTPASRSPAWQRSQGAAWLVTGLQTLKPVLPEPFAQRLP